MGTYPYIDTPVYNNFYEMLDRVYTKTPQEIAIRYRKSSAIEDITYERMLSELGSIYFDLKNKGFQGKNIGIIAENRYEYITTYLASAFLGVIAPIDKEVDEGTLWQMLDTFDINVLFYTNNTKHLVESNGSRIGLLCINLDEEYTNMLASDCSAEQILREVSGENSDRFSVLAFTSGTTGAVKGVMLSQRNITACIRGALQNNVLKSPTLVVLPMNHTYGFNPGLLCTFYNGGTVCLTMKIKEFTKDLKEYDPYFVSLVPMIIEGMYRQIMNEVRKQKKEKQLKRMIRISQGLLKWGIDIRKLLFGNLLNKRLKFISCGGAPLNPCYVERFMEWGIYLLNGYGLTECSPLVCINREFNMDYDSVGTVIKEDEVKIAEDGEILIKGPNIMLGYYKDEEETKKSIQDGYFHTGDLGYVKDRLLYVTGRKKNLIILGNGKNVSPELIESKLNQLPWVKESLVTTRQTGTSPILIALLYAADRPDSMEEDIEQINKSLPEYMQLVDYELVDTEFEKNSYQKIKREQYEKRK